VSAAHLRAVLHLIDRALAELPPGRGLVTREAHDDTLLDLRNAVEGAYIVEQLELETARQRRRLRRDDL
jgi:hypothetical protein